jgi:hypothetical protein
MKIGIVPSGGDTDKRKAEGQEFHEKKVATRKAITNEFSCDIHSLPDKAALCWKDPVQRMCYPISETNLNYWVTLHVSACIVFH